MSSDQHPVDVIITISKVAMVLDFSAMDYDSIKRLQSYVDSEFRFGDDHWLTNNTFEPLAQVIGAYIGADWDGIAKIKHNQIVFPICYSLTKGNAVAHHAKNFLRYRLELRVADDPTEVSGEEPD